MRSPLLVPVGWFVEYEPPWLGLAVMVSGLICLTVSYLRTVRVQKPLRYYALTVTAAGVALVPWFRTYPQPFVVLLTLVGSWFQGVGIVRGYLKLAHYAGEARAAIAGWLVDGDDGGTAANDGSGIRDHIERGTKTVSRLVLFQLLGLLGLVTSLWIGLALVAYGDLTIASLTTDVVVVWTLTTLFGGVVGFAWRFWSVREDLPPVLLLGVILLAVGAELQNFRSLQTEIALFLLNKLVFSLGFLGAVAIFVLQRAETDGRHGVGGD